MDPAVFASIAWLFLPLILLALLFLQRRRLKQARARHDKLQIDLDTASDALKALQDKYKAPEDALATRDAALSEVTALTQKIETLERQYDAKTASLKSDYATKRATLDELKRQVAVYDEQLSFAEFGMYEPHFDFSDSDAYKREIKDVRAAQKEMVSSKQATDCPTNWHVNDSLAKGRTMINRQTRLTMRAFNTECEAAIANTRWNNATAMERRFLNAAKQINSANASMNLTITEGYLALKLDELHLTHEYRERLKIEKDERAELARAEREEKRLLKEAAAAEREEQRYAALLAKARTEAGVDDTRIAQLEAELAAAHATTERARAMAEMTRCGYVYIISNIGSFGEDVVKIGLTRRLDPSDRVKELGDASVPFVFDTHAMIYSENAPTLEAALHARFADRRINQVNMRKEFFRVDISEVQKAVEELAPDARFFTDREAQDWHETLARRNAALTAQTPEMPDLPDTL